ncbi:MAG: hypothetical protein MJ025_07205, partial [Victivallaceae bacterium]|nr:hypothetical protein [Victivallaceae bacterium]
GKVSEVVPLLEEMRRGAYTIENAVAVDRFKTEFAAAMKKQDNASALKLVDGELKRMPDSLELAVAKTDILDRKLNRPEEARAVLESFVKTHPHQLPARELLIAFLRNHSLFEQIEGAAAEAAAEFAAEPAALVKLIGSELSCPPDFACPAALRHYASAISKCKCDTPRQQAVSDIVMSQVMGYFGNHEKAAELAERAAGSTDDDKTRDAAAKLARFHRSVLEAAKKLE